jgi:cytochrome c-type biogenesis protein CcmH/NrfG
MSDATLRIPRVPRDVVVWNRLSRVWIGALLLPVLALGAYALRGPPDAVSGPGDAAAVAPRAPALRDVLVAQLERNPRDGRAWVLLARLETAADRHAEAAADYAKAVAASTKVAADPAVWCEYADALAMAQGGLLAGQPRDLVMHALALDATHPKALEMAGGVAFEAGDYAAAAKYWRELLAQIPGTKREHGELAIAIARADELAGRR